MMFIHGSIALALITVLVTLFAHVEYNHKVDAACCGWRPYRCWVEGRFCFGSNAGGGCNIFCCNCEQGCCAGVDHDKICSKMCLDEPYRPTNYHLFSDDISLPSESQLGGPEQNFAFFDKNHDGVIDSDETRAHLGNYFNHSLFTGMDLNGNGVIDRVEFDQELK